MSAVIITRNSEATLSACLAALADLAEVVVYDNGSVDRTLEIAQSAANVKLYCGPFMGFGPTKNHAASLATHDWILSIDSDEYVSAELAAAVNRADRSNPAVAYALQRRNYFTGRLVGHSGWGNDWLPRLYNRRFARHSNAMVHENLVWDSGVVVRRLTGDLQHDAVRELGDLLTKVNLYSELRRAQGPAAHTAAGILGRSFWAFVRTYVLRGGFLDGWRGLIIAWSNANGVFFKYMKRYVDGRVNEELAPTEVSSGTSGLPLTSYERPLSTLPARLQS